MWEINLTASTKVSGDKKVGSTVTVTYNAAGRSKKRISLSAIAFIAGLRSVLPSSVSFAKVLNRRPWAESNRAL